MRPAPAEITDQIYRRWWADVFAMLVAMLVDKRRISLDRPTTSWSHDVLAEARISLAPLTAQIAVTAGELSPFPGDPVDRISHRDRGRDRCADPDEGHPDPQPCPRELASRRVVTDASGITEAARGGQGGEGHPPRPPRRPRRRTAR
jgi:hypothetical protein